jgi:Mg2+-importing ATPase
MDILCSDKTGTLTESTIQLHAALDAEGCVSERALLFAYLNATFQSGYVNPIDEAIRAYRSLDLGAYRKVDEVPYDFSRKRLSVRVEHEGQTLVITKGALANVLEVCTSVEVAEGNVTDLGPLRPKIQQQYEQLSADGFRVLGLAYRPLDAGARLTKQCEADMVFSGFLVLFAPLKPGIVETIHRLQEAGISLKIITGDNALVAASITRQAGISAPRLLAGAEIRSMSAAALAVRAADTDVFAEVEPNQKEHIIRALQKSGHVVGYMGDGINDVSALHVADVGLSVSEAVDVAKEAADIVLLEKDLSVLEQGVREGRITFANTLKYVFMATSANFGNMFSMAGASLFLPFLPLLPTQILLTNLFTDLPEMTIATDSVDPEMVDRPRRWDIGFIRRFMMVFGLANSACDYLTFGVLLLYLHTNPQQFRTGWFIENVVTAALIVLVVRTRRPFYRSRPGKYLVAATLGVLVLTILLPYTPIAHVLGFQPVAVSFLLVLALIMVFYVIVAVAPENTGVCFMPPP